MPETPSRKPRIIIPPKQTEAEPEPAAETTGDDAPGIAGVDPANFPSMQTPAAPKTDLASAGRNCAVCACSFFAMQANGQIAELGQCRAKSPVPFAVVVPRMVQTSGVPPYQWDSMTVWPLVRREQFCVQDFRPRAKDVQ